MYLPSQKPSPIQGVFSRRGFSPKAEQKVKVKAFFIATSVVRSVKNNLQTPDPEMLGATETPDLPTVGVATADEEQILERPDAGNRMWRTFQFCGSSQAWQIL